MQVPVYDSEGFFEIEGEGVENFLNLRVPFWWVEWSVRVDWALILLAVSAKYLPPKQIVDYAVSTVSESSPAEVYELTYLSFEEHTDYESEKRAVEKIAARISEEEWRGAKERLFYSLVYWMYVTRTTWPWWRYDMSYYLSTLWKDFDQPIDNELFTESAYEIDAAKWEKFVEDNWGRYKPSTSCEGIKVIKPWSQDDFHGEAKIARRLIAEPMGFLLAGTGEHYHFLRQLKNQLDNSEIIDERYTGVGYYIDFKINDASLRIDEYKQNVAFGDLTADSDDGLVGFVLYVDDGYISSLEAYTFGQSDWVPKKPYTNYRFTGKENETADPEDRDWEELVEKWSLSKTTMKVFPETTDDALMRAFVSGEDKDGGNDEGSGALFKWLKTGRGFSGLSFLLGPVYWFYRKCYFPAVVLSVLYVVFAFLLALGLLVDPQHLRSGLKLSRLAGLVVIGFIFPWLYRRHYIKVVGKERAKHPDDPTAVLKAVAQRGGNDPVTAIFVFLFLLVATALLIVGSLNVIVG